jgi:ADP-ribose pyrophosphatase YjhB (NUDIX family)
MDVYSLLDELQTIARNGLNFSKDNFDRERYERLMRLATQAYSELLNVPEELIRKRFSDELGYITPKVGTNAAIFNSNGEILLMERSDGSGNCLPCGFVEPNETPIEGIKREVLEETGLNIKIVRLVGVFTSMPSEKNGPHTSIAIVHLCESEDSTLTLSHEGLALRYWSIDEVKNWHRDHERQARAAYKMWKSAGTLHAFSD